MDSEPPSKESAHYCKKSIKCSIKKTSFFLNGVPIFLIIDTPSIFIGVILILVLLILALIFLRQFLGLKLEIRKLDQESAQNVVEDTNTISFNSSKVRKEMAGKIDKLGEVQVRQIMQARVSVVAISKEMDFQQLLEIVRQSGYSRIPVYENDLDSITGILHVKDLIGLDFGKNEDFNWQKLIRTPVLYVPEAKKIDQVLGSFLTKHQHLAIVVDEYGGTAGLLTMEDVLEEIFGEIQDEFDEEPDIIYQMMEDGSYIFEGRTLIHDFCKIMKIDSSYFEDLNSEADSIAGLILAEYGELPAKNIQLQIMEFKFEILAASNRRIEQIRVNKLN